MDFRTHSNVFGSVAIFSQFSEGSSGKLLGQMASVFPSVILYHTHANDRNNDKHARNNRGITIKY